jgi:tyrosine-protein phosphatase SIW14
MMTRVVPYIFGGLVAALVVGGPLTYASYRESQFRNFRVVRPDVLYRSGQLSLDGLKCVLHDCGIRTVVTLRDAELPTDPPPDLEEQRYCEAQEINYCRISPRTWWAADGSIPAEEGVRQFCEVMDNPANYPVLLHCYAGLHRSGAFSAVYRMEYEDWENDQAIAEMRANGYHELDDAWDLRTYLEGYRPRGERSGREASVPIHSSQSAP